MFERYTELARRAIFFARYEASQTGSASIEPEHLLLGLMHEDKLLLAALPPTAVEQIRNRFEPQPQAEVKRISTSVDLPLSPDAKRVLAMAAEEADELGHRTIDCGHLVLGLLRLERGMAPEVMKTLGFRLNGYRALVAENIVEGNRRRFPFDRAMPRAPVPLQPLSPSLEPSVTKLDGLIAQASERFDDWSTTEWDRRAKRNMWTRKDLLGHLTDWATAHQQWFARALTEPKLVAAGYPADEWVEAQKYGGFSQHELVLLFVSLNHLLIHVIKHIPEAKLQLPCRIGIADPIPLEALVTRYVEHLEDVLGQILTHG